MVDALNPPSVWPPFGTFSMAVLQGAGQVVHLKGQVALDPSGQIVGPGDMRAQVRQTLDNIAAVAKREAFAPSSPAWAGRWATSSPSCTSPPTSSSSWPRATSAGRSSHLPTPSPPRCRSPGSTIPTCSSRSPPSPRSPVAASAVPRLSQGPTPHDRPQPPSRHRGQPPRLERLVHGFATPGLFRAAAGLLAEGGHLVVHETHPFLEMLDPAAADPLLPARPAQLPLCYTLVARKSAP